MNTYEYWLSLGEDMKTELESIKDPAELEDRFYRELAFGTGGMRGIMGAGPNRMNKYIIAKATSGLADMLLDKNCGGKGVAIAYDSRNNSALFARTAAGVLAAKGIKAYLFTSIMPTPVLSFAVRHLGCAAGIVITASHNPKEYNGYKVYNADGCQLVPHEAKELTGYIAAVTDIAGIKTASDEESGELIVPIGDDVLDPFISEVKKLSLYSESSSLRIVYTPLHGTGNIPVRRALAGRDVVIAEKQEMPDGNFSTVRSPNPEEKDALLIAIEKAKETGADIVIGTDPDCDRVGVAVRNGSDFALLTGNQTGALLLDFIMKFRHYSAGDKPAVVTTIVTGSLGCAVAKKHGLEVFETLTGFKYIGEKIGEWERTGEHTYVFGYEESYGYLAGTFARDKDAVSSSMLIAEMAAYYKNRGETLLDALDRLYKEHGYFGDYLETVVLKGKDGAEKIQSAMSAIRDKGKAIFADCSAFYDYSRGIGTLPKENALKFVFDDGSWAAVRPSGTEPKLKLYFSVRGENKQSADERINQIKSKLMDYVG